MKNNGILWVLLAYVAYRLATRQGVGSVGPLMPVGAIGNTDPNAGLVQLPDGSYVTPDAYSATMGFCDRAPLNSFGENCYGRTWQYVSGGKVDLRTAPAPSIDFVTNPGPGPASIDMVPYVIRTGS